MRLLVKLFLISFVGLGVVCGGMGCGSLSTPIIQTTMPTWIAASWSGGAAGPPNDRRDEEATEWDGLMCPASSVELTNHSGGFSGLNIINRCEGVAVTYAICRTKGTLPQPEFGLEECADDPFETPFSRLKFLPITPGTEGDYINATENISINIFYCSDEQTITGPPLRCL